MIRLKQVLKNCQYIVIILLCILSLKIMTQAQSPNILRIAIPSIGTFIPDEVLRTFEAHHPDLQLQIINIEPSLFFPDLRAENPQDYLSSIENLVEQADVILINDQIVFGASISGTYLLDLSPIIIEDSELTNTMHPVAIEAFRDNNIALWGIANSVGINTILYNPTALETANLNPPNANWTLLDYEQAATTLQEPNGEASVLLTSPGMFIRSLYGEPIISVTDGHPQFAQVGISTLLSDFQQLRDNNLVDIDSSVENRASYLIQSGSITSILDEDNTLAVAPYPNDAADFFAWGFGVSLASEQPILAYELALFLATEVDLSTRTSGLPLNNDSLETALASYNPDTRTLIETVLESPSTLLDRLYTLYLNQAVDENMSSMDELDSLQADAIALFDMLGNASNTTVLVLPTAIPELEPNAEQISLRFGVSSRLTSPYRQEWQRIIDEFVMQDSEVGDVLLISTLPDNSTLRLSQETDCFYMPSNHVPGIDLSRILSLSPLIFADATFDPDDFIGSDLSFFERDNQVWALPMVIRPTLLQIDREQLTNANYPMPTFNWTPSEFEQSLLSIDATLANDSAPMQIFSPLFIDNGMTLLMLIAGYDGLPIDYRTSPPTLDFTSPENITAIRTVLNLARERLIDYAPQSPQITVFYPNPNEVAPIMPVDFGTNTYRRYIDQGTDWVSLPMGRSYSPVSYDVGVASISSGTTAPEACYRFMRTLSQNPHLFIGLPAYQSQISGLDLTVTSYTLPTSLGGG